MSKILMIHNCVYLPIDKDYDDKSEQKYFGASVSGYIFPNQILTESEIRTKFKDSPLREVDGLLQLKEVYDKH